MAISAALADVYLGNPHGVYFIEAIDIEHAALTSALHYTNASFGVTGLLDNALLDTASYIPLPFTATLPEKNTDGNQSLDLSISNVTAELVGYIDQMAAAPQSPITLTYRVFLSSQVSASGHYLNQLTPPWRYEVSSVALTATEALMSATKVNIHNRLFPRVRYTRTSFPGLAR
ncbi:MAG: DUF1833 family protein [Halieaceae bacterium]|jgi:hypothetical protein|nr:DUF1833 family protein [Halieaceae bacterium]